MSQSIAIIGAGPSGCALACFLAEKGWNCVVFDDGEKPDLLVGESLIPAAIPIIRRLGIENEVANISALKKGAALQHSIFDSRVDFEFQNLGSKSPNYAYNIPRPQFDALLIARAKELGVSFVHEKGEVVKGANPTHRELELSRASLSAAGFVDDKMPDLIVDSTGRTRLFSKTLKLNALRGPRNDVAHFAHFENYSVESAIEGQIVISVLECGWSWQIPLEGKHKGKTSVGVVLDAKAAAHYGNTAKQRLEKIIAAHKVLQRSDSRRVSAVKTYSNYQLLSEKAHGPGWALVGDALGFVDPMLSPGVFMALESAQQLEAALTKTDSKYAKQERLDRYYQTVCHWHDSWTNLIDYFYDGRLLKLGDMRANILENSTKFSFGMIADWFITKVLAQLISGAGTTNRIYRAALSHTCNHLLREDDRVSEYSIKSQIEKNDSIDSPKIKTQTNQKGGEEQGKTAQQDTTIAA